MIIDWRIASYSGEEHVLARHSIGSFLIANQRWVLFELTSMPQASRLAKCSLEHIYIMYMLNCFQNDFVTDFQCFDSNSLISWFWIECVRITLFPDITLILGDFPKPPEAARSTTDRSDINGSKAVPNYQKQTSGNYKTDVWIWNIHVEITDSNVCFKYSRRLFWVPFLWNQSRRLFQ